MAHEVPVHSLTSSPRSVQYILLFRSPLNANSLFYSELKKGAVLSV